MGWTKMGLELSWWPWAGLGGAWFWLSLASPILLHSRFERAFVICKLIFVPACHKENAPFFCRILTSFLGCARGLKAPNPDPRIPRAATYPCRILTSFLGFAWALKDLNPDPRLATYPCKILTSFLGCALGLQALIYLLF